MKDCSSTSMNVTLKNIPKKRLCIGSMKTISQTLKYGSQNSSIHLVAFTAANSSHDVLVLQLRYFRCKRHCSRLQLAWNAVEWFEKWLLFFNLNIQTIFVICGRHSLIRLLDPTFSAEVCVAVRAKSSKFVCSGLVTDKRNQCYTNQATLWEFWSLQDYAVPPESDQLID